MSMVSELPISTELMEEFLDDPSCGGRCVFEGRVRNHHGGRAVTRLVYEAYLPMANKELEAICAEAMRAFKVSHVVARHRVGWVPIGEMAVYIGVASAHRDPAFSACRYVIEEIKKRLPVWKEETYRSAKSEAKAHSAM